MFFDRRRALEALPELSGAEREAIEALLPGPVTLVLPNRNHRFAPACAPAGAGVDSLGLRVPLLGDSLSSLQSMAAPMMQTSANLSGGPEARRLADVPRELLLGASLALDGGELPGIASTVLVLRDYELTGAFKVLREGALALGEIERALA